MSELISDSKENADKLIEYKEEGNKSFKCGDYENAISLYSTALQFIDDNNIKCKDERLALYKNLSAAFLKLNDYENSIINASLALKLNGNDVKALYRRCQAFESSGRFNDAFKDALAVQYIEPNNTLIQSTLRRLNIKLQEVAKENSSSYNRVKQMLEYLTQESLEYDKRLQAANNLIVLAREKASARMICESNGLQIIINALKAKEKIEFKIACIRTLSELCKNDIEISLNLLKLDAIQFFVDVMQLSSDDEYITSIQFTIQTIIDAFSGLNKKDDKKVDKKAIKNMINLHEKELDSIMSCLVKNVASRALSGPGRDSILVLIMRNVPYDALNWGVKLVDMDGLSALLEVASELEEIKYESSFNITPSTRTHVSITLDRVYNCMDHDKVRERYHEKVTDFIDDKLKGADIESKVRATAAITALMQGPIDVGNICLARQGVIEMMLAMAGSDDELQQRVAAEAIIAAATKKDKCTSLASMGAGILKNLYKSTKDSIKVRALVGLCKLGSVGGTDASIRPFSEGSNSKLSEACRKFLKNPSKDRDLRKWAAEGLAYLTLDADIKEELINDKEALLALVELSRAGDLSVLYGVVTTLVNLTNSYEKQEVIPELIELAKFAKQHVPEDHPKDDKQYIDARCKVLAEMQVTTALVALSKSESITSREMMSRIFNAICEQSSLRGTVVQQGGAKVLLKMALENNTESGKKHASQALARIGITINPEIAFVGQRCCEVVRPLISLLHPDCSGLQNFEALMALTNLAQVSPSVRTRIIKDEGFSRIEHYMYEDHEMIKRAAVQCMVNMVSCEEVVKLYEGENDRVKYLVILSEDEDYETAKAAAGALAMLTSVSKKCCTKVYDAKCWHESLLQLVSSKDQDLQHRGVCIVYNLIDVEGECAEKIVATNILEVLMAIVRPEVDDINNTIKDIANKCLKRAQELELIKSFSASEIQNDDDE